MNILVLNGSPKGDYSITLHTVLYLKELFPQDNFEILHVGQRIRTFEKDFSTAVSAIEAADVLLFSYPVYTFIAPYQMHRFIELMKENNVSVNGKIATQITTSKHFYDVTAHRYIQDNVQEMGMNFIRGLSADMEDLPTKKGQEEAKKYWEHFHFCVEQNIFEPFYLKNTPPAHKAVEVPANSKYTKYQKKGNEFTYASFLEDLGKSKSSAKNVVIVADLKPEDKQLANMIARFQSHLSVNSHIVNIQNYPFKGGCLGCFNCATDGICIYKDGFDTFLREDIQTADAIIYAFSIKDHSLGTRFKMYDDRQFCNGHRTVTMGMPIGYLISGNYSEEQNLQMIIEGRAQVGGNILAGIATDEFAPNETIDQMATSLEYALTNKNTQPQNFYGVGGMKIFRDLIYQMQGMMKADYKFFKAHGQFDFPQKKKSTIIGMYLVGAMLSNKKLKSKIGNNMNEGMIMSHRKVVEEAKNKTR
ncbi:MAG: NAD(P)H-dependent oxidoreductase [Agathobacter sp.]|nr:NAD(P)H-dependent oxidoreductase [Agathobacter sp.]